MTFTAPTLNLTADTPTPEQFQAELLTIARSHDLTKLTALIAGLDRSHDADWIEALGGAMLYLPEPDLCWLVIQLTAIAYGWHLLTRATTLITGEMAA